MISIPIMTRKILLPTIAGWNILWMKTSLKDKNRCRALRAVQSHLLLFDFLFITLCFPRCIKQVWRGLLDAQANIRQCQAVQRFKKLEMKLIRLKKSWESNSKTCITLNLQYWETVFKVFEICLGETRATDPIIQQNFTQFVTSPSASAKQITPSKIQTTNMQLYIFFSINLT